MNTPEATAKKAYAAPILVKHGNVAELTMMNNNRTKIDVPIGTPIDPTDPDPLGDITS
ncbi:MAG: lasso RiPP family leader peptide-containing protein [Sumerlaeia bacterium]